MVKKTILKDRAEWLKKRSVTIGGSDAAAVIGLSPWKSNVELWEEKTRKADDERKEEDNATPLMIYGTMAEEHLRELFRLDYPSVRVMYEENNLFKNTSYPWAHASLDGWLEEDGLRGVLEIKTANVMSTAQSLKWQGKIPDYYYAQVLHEMAVYDADFAYVKAQLKRERDGEVELTTKHYYISRMDVEDEIDYLMDAEEAFWESVQMGRKPSLILPEI